MRRRILVGTLGSLVFVTALYTECATVKAKDILADPNIALIFGGRVVDIHDAGEGGLRITFAVQRVWKGSIPARIDVYANAQNAERHRLIALVAGGWQPQGRSCRAGI